ncbi:MAG: hypothetical protein EP330_30785 [Deltaproteobacteria bacterium]|nr:MAG: hypothetical protein EP330_30785 [Deltaproteobacteria bacterium]
MADFTGTFDETFDLPVDVATAVAHFSNTDVVAANYGVLESYEKVGDDSLALVLPNQNHGVTSFQGRYTGTWKAVGDNAVEWSTKPGSGNLVSEGRATFAPTAGGCRMTWRSKITITMDVNRFIGKALGPVVGTFVSREMRAYCDRMIAALPR